MDTSVSIVSIGARTPLGLNSSAAAAAVRAGISSMGEHPFMVDQVGDPMPGSLDTFLEQGILGPERMLALAETALREVCAPLEKIGRISLLKLPLYLALPEIRPGFTEKDAGLIRAGFARFGGLPIEISDVTTLAEGHAAGISALGLAAEQIRRGETEACLIGGLESYFQPDTMEWLDDNRQLAGSVSRSGFVPGEGAGFCLLMNDGVRKRLGLGALGHVLTVAVGRETNLIKSSDICLGEGLTDTVRNSVHALRLPTEAINDVICDINSERYRGEEWGFVCLRLSQYFDNPTAYLSPADCWGDMGAASGPLFAMLACQAKTRGYAMGTRTLIWTSSEGGLRASTLLQFDGNTGHV